MRFFWPSLALALFIGGGCTLSTFPQAVHLSMKAPSSPTAVRGARSGPELRDMKCYGVVVGGAPGAVAASQIEGRSPSCLGLNGAFFGPYNYDAMVAGISITLPTASYDFSLVGFHNVADCGAGVSDLYKAGNAVQNFAIGPAVTVNLSTASKVEIPANLYTPASAADRTPGCPPPATQDCSGATACDMFTDVNDKLLHLHPLDSGGSWSITNPNSPYIYNNAARATSGDNTGIDHGLHTTAVGTGDISLTASVSIGQWSIESSVGLTARYGDSLNFVGVAVTRDDQNTVCHLKLFQYVAGINNLLDIEMLAYPAECPYDEFSTITLTTNGASSEGSYRGHTVTSLATSSSGGASAGFLARNEGIVTTRSLVDFWRADLVP